MKRVLGCFQKVQIGYTKKMGGGVCKGTCYFLRREKFKNAFNVRKLKATLPRKSENVTEFRSKGLVPPAIKTKNQPASTDTPKSLQLVPVEEEDRKRANV